MENLWKNRQLPPDEIKKMRERFKKAGKKMEEIIATRKQVKGAETPDATNGSNSPNKN